MARAWLALLLMTAVPMLGVAQPPPPAPPMPMPSLTDPNVVVVTTGQELADALANPLKTFAWLVSKVEVNESDFPSTVIARSTNLTISGTPGPQTSWPLLELNFVKGKIRLENNTALIFQYVVVHDFRQTPLGQSPGFDIVATSTSEAGALVIMQDAILMLRICVPKNMQAEIMSSIVRPSNLPGKQLAYNTTQVGCINSNSSTVPPISRCWPDVGMYADVAVGGFDIDAFGRATTTRYSLYMLRVPYLCERQMTDECVTQLGPLGCYLSLFPRTPTSATSGTPGTSPSPFFGPPVVKVEKKSPGTLTGVVAGVVAGVVVLGVITLAMLLVVRFRRRRAAEQRKAAYEESKRAAASAPEGNGGDATGDGDDKGDGKSTTVCKQLPPGQANTGTSRASTSVCSPASTSTALANKLPPSTGATSSVQQQPSTGRNIILPSGVGTCVLSSTDLDSSSPLVIVTPFTPHRSDLKLDVQCDTEVKLLPIIRGKGSYGRVVEGLYGGQRVAVKLVVDVDEWSGPSDSLVNSFAQEVEVLGRCQHPNVVRLLAACLKPPRLCLVMELMDTSLERMVHAKSGDLMPLPTVLHIAADIARGLAYLHPTIVHRDLKPGNVLLSNTDSPRPIAKLTDFGLSRLRSTVLVTRHPEAGTPAYMAPEAFDASNYVITHKADIYALGVILWEMLTGSVPWEGCSMVAIAYSITVRHHRLPLSKLDAARCPPKLRKLIHQCWDPDPQRRPAAAELAKQLTLVLQLVQGECEAPSSNCSQRSNANISVGAENSRLPHSAGAGSAGSSINDRHRPMVAAAAAGGAPGAAAGSGGAGGSSSAKAGYGYPGSDKLGRGASGAPSGSAASDGAGRVVVPTDSTSQLSLGQDDPGSCQGASRGKERVGGSSGEVKEQGGSAAVAAAAVWDMSPAAQRHTL
ncbi:hypothetical protein VOLCADRAFT_96407 [Volvox carteri f. nagariensis]|uniref:Protein kinase domain-containing protein n=1 Tax=Volvox carteri f. nagariensis TaxID=3068 RepID=D8UA12_VOLCA|nr:uncharacterized protein VOLCADRAFT_96407 [Volvox carteri f. nagariensis]EFJ43391.1 hypothetical protein VOLCADRAFT_96407 [Volvox carteri f. nagariensis]|eukprot:XP_002955538.1 hypothetical protein VOLCADRAFT_96407 [Volvox carteri f. nagariensis]